MANLNDSKKSVRVYIDGCFDMFHFGHANALRQAKECGDVLVVGVHSDVEIRKHKGPTVLTEQERYKMVRSCKWVDELVENAPYIASVETLDKHKCDFVCHGEDISLGADGKDVYENVKKCGRLRTIKRTEGISTTELVGRMLLMTSLHHSNPSSNEANQPITHVNTSDISKHSPYTGVSHFLPTTRKIALFMEGLKSPKSGDKIVYIDGAFDLFHVGHVDALRRAHELGGYLIVGVHEDGVVNCVKGSNYPIMNIHERVMSVLSCRYADEVVIGAPYCVTQEMMDQLKIDLVVHGDDHAKPDPQGRDPYEVPKHQGKFEVIKHTPGMAVYDIVQRIIDNRMKYEERNKNKEAKELEYISKGDGEKHEEGEKVVAKQQSQ